MSRGGPTYSQSGMALSRSFRFLAADAAQRAVADLANPKFGKETGRDCVPMTYTPHACETIVLCGMALEAGINEIAIFLNTHGNKRGTLASDFFGRRLVGEPPRRGKWDEIAFWEKGSRFPRRNPLWQDFVSLVEIRNRFVHFTWNPKHSAPRCMQHLISRDLALPPNPSTSWWDAAMTNRVAQWSIRVVDEMFAEMIRLVPNQDLETWK